MSHFTPAKDNDQRVRGRGATNNPAARYMHEQREIVADDWSDFRSGDSALKTTVTLEHPKSIISRNSSPDLPFDRSINPYRGCEHGCIYCYARPTHAYMDLSPGLDFESQLFAKPDAAALLEKALSAPSYQCQPIAFGTNTDPYQPIEKDYGITRQLLSLLARCKHPFTITTKSDLVLRDLDILAPLAKENLTCVSISLTSLDNRLSRLMEPRASAPHKRLAAIRKLSEAGIRVIVQIAPVIPAINDMEIERILAAAKENGAAQATHIPIRLPLEVAPLFRDWLAKHYPDRASKVMKLIQSIRGGKDYDSRFGQRMRGSGPYADLIRSRFTKAARDHGFKGRKYDLATDLFEPPSKPSNQMSLF